MDYLAKYTLEYQTTSELWGITDVKEVFDKEFRQDNKEKALEFANAAGKKMVDEINRRYDCGNAKFKLERLLEITEVSVR